MEHPQFPAKNFRARKCEIEEAQAGNRRYIARGFQTQSRDASVRLRFGGGTVRAVPVFGSGGSSAKKGFSLFQYSLTGKDGSGSGFGSWKTVPAVPVPLSLSGVIRANRFASA